MSTTFFFFALVTAVYGGGMMMILSFLFNPRFFAGAVIVFLIAGFFAWLSRKIEQEDQQSQPPD